MHPFFLSLFHEVQARRPKSLWKKERGKVSGLGDGRTSWEGGERGIGASRGQVALFIIFWSRTGHVCAPSR